MTIARPIRLQILLLLGGLAGLDSPGRAAGTGGSFARTADVPYATGTSLRLVGDVYQPAGSSVAPAVLLIHGGGWISLDKASLAPVAELMARNGFLVYAINYRRLPEAPWPACLQDCVAALQVLRSDSFRRRFHLAALPVVIAGASAGAHLALMTGLSRPPGEVAAILAFAAPSRLAVNMPTCDKFLFTPAFFAEFFGPQAVTREALDAASPRTLVGATSPPLWLIHSQNDQLIPLEHSAALAARYQQLGLPVRVHYFAGTDTLHGIWVNNAATPHVLAPAARAALEQSLVEIKNSLSTAR